MYIKSLRISLLIIISIATTGCFRPGHSFSYYKETAKPDYSDTSNWAALPTKIDSADAVPINSAEMDGQSTARVDVFYIHPTVNFSARSWNADLANEKLNKRTDEYPIRMQASAFNGSCKVYAPRYRQATLYSFIEKKTDSGEQALALAYSDVLAAFDYYIRNYNQDRPFIIASHSQGSRHAFKLLRDRIENDPILLDKFICAYAIGFTTDSIYTKIQACDSSTQTGCLISWNSYKWGSKTDNKLIGVNKYCTNPLSWKRDTSVVSKKNNFGGVDRNFKFIANATDAKVNEGILWVHNPKKGKFVHIGKNYHISDYNLFYMNIRKNVAARIDSYFENQK